MVVGSLQTITDFVFDTQDMEGQVFRAELIIAACGDSWCSAERTAGFCIFY